MTPESAFTALRELLHGAGIPSRSLNGASDRERAVTPSRRALPTWIGDINALDMAFMGVVAMALGVAIVA